MVDMHKEIKLSDLFKRGSKDSGDGQNGDAPKPPKKVKPPKEPKRRKEPKQKAPNAAALTEHEAPPPADIPLMRAFNLLPREEARTVKEGASSPVPQVLVALAGVLVFAVLAALYLMAGTDVTAKKGQVEDLRAELAAYQATAQQQQPSVEDKSAALANERVGRTNALASALGRESFDLVLTGSLVRSPSLFPTRSASRRFRGAPRLPRRLLRPPTGLPSRISPSSGRRPTRPVSPSSWLAFRWSVN